jgi:hypothetical protein
MTTTDAEAGGKPYAVMASGDVDTDELVRMLQAHTPLEQLSNMQARTVFEFMEQRGYQVTRKYVR